MNGRRIGFIINPIAGMGGAVGLNGTDGAALGEARRRGAVAIAARRAELALDVLAERRGDLEILAASGEMGERTAGTCGFLPIIVHSVRQGPTGPDDTRVAAMAMAAEGVELILFAGGDGTARDILEAVGAATPMLGIPAGVKMHSAVFATNPRNAGRLTSEFLFSATGKAQLGEAEIMDREDGPGGSPRLFGYARTPHLPMLRQAAKASPSTAEDAELDAACGEIAALASDDRVTIIGPGTTTRRIKRMLGVEGALLGVDVFRSGKLIIAETGEPELLALVSATPARIVVGIVGGQGYLFGRGNQQISGRVIKLVGKENILVLASLSKLVALGSGRLYVDTGDDEVDAMLSGHMSVRTGPGRRVMFKVAGA